MSNFDALESSSVGTWGLDGEHEEPPLTEEEYRQYLTYELEALSTRFKNRKGEPIGLGIYMVEYMRHFGIPCKPQPPEDDDDLLKELSSSAEEKFKRKIRPQVDTSFVDEIVETIKEPIRLWLREQIEKIFTDHLDELNKHLTSQDVKAIRHQIGKQYERKPKREIYSIEDIADKLFEKVNVEVETPGFDVIKEKIQKLMEELKSEMEKVIQNWTYKETIEFKDLHDPGEPKNFYDVVLEQLGVEPKDAELVREALKWRLGVN